MGQWVQHLARPAQEVHGATDMQVHVVGTGANAAGPETTAHLLEGLVGGHHVWCRSWGGPQMRHGCYYPHDCQCHPYRHLACTYCGSHPAHLSAYRITWSAKSRTPPEQVPIVNAGTVMWYSGLSCHSTGLAGTGCRWRTCGSDGHTEPGLDLPSRPRYAVSKRGVPNAVTTNDVVTLPIQYCWTGDRPTTGPSDDRTAGLERNDHRPAGCGFSSRSRCFSTSA